LESLDRATPVFGRGITFIRRDDDAARKMRDPNGAVDDTSRGTRAVAVDSQVFRL